MLCLPDLLSCCCRYPLQAPTAAWIGAVILLTSVAGVDMVTFTSKLDALLAARCANSRVFFCQAGGKTKRKVRCLKGQQALSQTCFVIIRSKKLLLLFQVAVT